MKYIFILLFMICALSCTRSPQQKKVSTGSINKKQDTTLSESLHNTAEQHATMKFVNYNDDGDYFLLIAQKGDSTYSFINNNDENRSLNRGDLIEVTWKKGTITIAGDGDTPADADMLISVKKTGDGPVSKFRNSYGKKIKYTWPEDESYSQSYLDNLYRLVEYYLSNTKVPLLQHHINKKDDLSYSVEQQLKGNREYTTIGIATTNEHSVNTIQWLYYDNEHDKLFEYDLPSDALVEFH
jgi:hypothetical protein